ncbi:GAF domain-containing SpoIIE family protein phosphatase [Actinoplanes sp. NPDC026619]|uniref:PP2C family protein-serine/threonine phosphatase n=1 Tax=Actinoplanes sp. NPDC026619 TaxID=3155798 RepID=UPI0033C6603F
MLTSPARLAAVHRTRLVDTGPEEPFDRLTRLACELLDAPFGFVTVVDDQRSFWKSCIGITSTDLADRQNPVEESFCQYIIATDDAVVIDDARLNPMTSNNPSIESMGVVAWAGFPVRSPDGQVLGSFCVVDNRPRAWSPQDVRTLEVLAHAAGGEVALRIAADEAAHDAEQARAAAGRYRQLARTVQESLLPHDLPVIDGLDIGVAYRMAESDVLGDFFDAVQTPTGWAVFLGDVAGSGASAARTSALAKYTLRAAAVRASSPAIVLTELDTALHRWFAETGSSGFVTLAYLSVRPSDTGFAVRLCTAGHPPAAVRRADGTVETFGLACTPLGLLPRLNLKIQDLELHEGDVLALCTNGVTEAGAPESDAVFGPDGVHAVLRRAGTTKADEIADSLLGEALRSAGGQVSDDMVIIVLSVR